MDNPDEIIDGKLCFTGEDEIGNSIIGRFEDQKELDEAMDTLEGAWMLDISKDSSIQITD